MQWGVVFYVHLAIYVLGRRRRGEDKFERLKNDRDSVMGYVLGRPAFKRIALRRNPFSTSPGSPFACGYKNAGQDSPVTT